MPRYLLLKQAAPYAFKLLALDQRDRAQGLSHLEVEEDTVLSLDLAIGTMIAYSFINISATERGENNTLTVSYRDLVGIGLKTTADGRFVE
jgi:hypothetical protein